MIGVERCSVCDDARWVTMMLATMLGVRRCLECDDVQWATMLGTLGLVVNVWKGAGSATAVKTRPCTRTMHSVSAFKVDIDDSTFALR